MTSKKFKFKFNRAKATVENENVLTRMAKARQDLDLQFSIIRDQLRSVNSKHEVLKRMRTNIKKLSQNEPLLVMKERVNVETELLNDYNYLRQKQSRDNAEAVRGLRSRSASSQYSCNMSAITGQSDYERFLDKWDQVLKSGMGNNQADYSYLNEFAVQMIPRHD